MANSHVPSKMGDRSLIYDIASMGGARRRAALLASSALLTLPLATMAQAQTTARPEQAIDQAQSASPERMGAVPGLRVVDEPQIVISQPGTTTSTIHQPWKMECMR